MSGIQLQMVGLFVLVTAVGGCSSGRGTPDAVAPPPLVEALPAPPGAVEKPSVAVECADEPGMIYIPGGHYVEPSYKVDTQLAGFWIDRTEVTVAAYRAYVAADHSPPYDTRSNCNWSVPGGDDLPINCIDWYQAEAFCLWSKKRLPTADEWSWAAQGREEQRRYPWGDTRPSCDLAVVDMDDTDEVTGCGRERPWPVGSKPTDATRDGVLDMLGNVAEKTSTGYSADPRSTRYQMGSNWANKLGPYPLTRYRFPMVYEAWSDKAGVRCVKDVGPRPPCTTPR